MNHGLLTIHNEQIMLAPIMFVVIEFDRNSINSDELCDAKKAPFALTFLSEPSDLSHGQSKKPLVFV